MPMACIQGCTKITFPGCVKLGEKVAFCLPTAGRRMPLFRLIFTQPGAHLLGHPCRSTKRRSITHLGLSPHVVGPSVRVQVASRCHFAIGPVSVAVALAVPAAIQHHKSKLVHSLRLSLSVWAAMNDVCNISNFWRFTVSEF